MNEFTIAVAEKWNINPIAIMPLTTNVHKVTTESGQQFILKQGVNPEYIMRSQTPLYAYLRNNHFPSPTVVGEVQLVAGKHTVLYTYLPGEVVRDDMPAGVLNRSKLYGAVAGHMHLLLSTYPQAGNFRKSNLYDHVFNWALPTITGHNRPETIQKVVSRIHSLSEQARILQKLPSHLIHRDFHRGNFLFLQDEPSGVIDLDGCVQNVRLFDPCYMATSILAERFDDSGGAAWVDVLESILKGYGAVNRLHDIEWEAVLYVVLYIQTIFVAYMADADPGAAEMNASMFHWIWEQRNTIEARMRKASLAR